MMLATDKKYINYDENPIVIKDHNPEMMFYAYLFFITPIVMIIAYFDGHYSRYGFSLVFFGLFVYRVYIATKGKRKVILKNNEIKYMHLNQELETISTTDSTVLYKGFQDYYTNRQEMPDIGKVIVMIFFPLILIMQIFLFSTKFIFQVYKKGIRNYDVFDSIIVLNNDKVINIFPTSKQEYEEVNQYIKNTFNQNINQLPMYIKWIYREENLKGIR